MSGESVTLIMTLHRDNRDKYPHARSIRRDKAILAGGSIIGILRLIRRRNMHLLRSAVATRITATRRVGSRDLCLFKNSAHRNIATIMIAHRHLTVNTHETSDCRITATGDERLRILNRSVAQLASKSRSVVHVFTITVHRYLGDIVDIVRH